MKDLSLGNYAINMNGRDIAAAISIPLVGLTVTALTGGIGPAVLGTGFALAGFTAKKLMPKDMNRLGKAILAGLVTVGTAGFGTIPFLTAAPGLEAKNAVSNVRQQVAQARYGAES